MRFNRGTRCTLPKRTLCQRFWGTDITDVYDTDDICPRCQRVAESHKDYHNKY